MITPSLESYSTTSTTHTPLRHLIQTAPPSDSNLMLTAIISLLLIILFVLLLHIYARWFLVHARQRSRSPVTVSHVLASRLHRFTIIDTTSDHSFASNGLHPSLISSIPLFVHHNAKDNEIANGQNGLECAICISLFERHEVGRKLPKCGHAFHVECIDMWLYSHSTCPICRAGVVCETKMNNVDSTLEEISNAGSHLEIDVIEDSNTENADEDNSSVTNDRVPGFSSSESSLLMRILSTNRSERKVHPSASNVSELEI